MPNAKQFLFSTCHAVSNHTRLYTFPQVDNEEDINKKAKKKEVNSKKYCGSFKCKVPFKCEWKVDFPIKEVYNDKYKFYCLPCGKNLSF